VGEPTAEGADSGEGRPHNHGIEVTLHSGNNLERHMHYQASEETLQHWIVKQRESGESWKKKAGPHDGDRSRRSDNGKAR